MEFDGGSEQPVTYTWLPGTTWEDAEREVILSCLEAHNWNRTHAARALDMSLRTLRCKLARYQREKGPLGIPRSSPLNVEAPPPPPEPPIKHPEK